MIKSNQDLLLQARAEIEDGERSFPTVETSIEIFKRKLANFDETEFRYVFNCEESDLEDFDINGDTDKQLRILRDNHKENGWSEMKISNSMPFDEFTADICPALNHGQIEKKLAEL